MADYKVSVSVVPDDSLDEWIKKAVELNDLLRQAKRLIEEIKAKDLELHFKRNN